MSVTVTRTVVCSPEHSSYVTIDRSPVVPACVSRFDPGARVEVTRTWPGLYAVRAIEGDHRRVFEPELWHVAR